MFRNRNLLKKNKEYREKLSEIQKSFKWKDFLLLIRFFCYEKCGYFSANIYLLKVNRTNTRKRGEIYAKLIIMSWNEVNDVVLVSLLLTLNIFHTFY